MDLKAFTSRVHRSRLRLHLRPAWLREARRANNPLLRRLSAWEITVATLGVGLLLAALVGLGLVLNRQFATGVATERLQARTWTSVVATVENAPTAPVMGSYGSSAPQSVVNYQWHGSLHRDVTLVSLTDKPGTQLRLWVDENGRLTSSPQSRAVTVMQVGMTALGGVLLVAALGWRGRAAYQGWLLRRRGEQWDLEWLELAGYGRRHGTR